MNRLIREAIQRSRLPRGVCSTPNNGCRWQPTGKALCQWTPKTTLPPRNPWLATHRTFSSDTTGEDIYRKAMQAMDDIKKLQESKESERSHKMYEAWAKAEEAEKSQKTQGVTVVKTLVKETRKQMSNQDEKEEELQRLADALLREAAVEHGHPMALVQLGNMALEEANSKHVRGSIKKRREKIDEAIEFFERAGKNGSRVGWYNLGHLYWTGYPAIDGDMLEPEENTENGTLTVQEEQVLKADVHKAMDAFVNAIDLGDQDAMYLVGVHRMTSGGRENIYSGLRLVERAGNEGHGGALYYLALLHLNGEPNIGLEPCSQEEFRVRLDKACDAGNVDAIFTRGHSYYHGTEGYPQNYQRALQDFLKGAEEGHADSAVSAGAMLHTGIGVQQNQERAFELYQLAGELGSVDGWKNVVACYSTGEGVPKSLETARYIAETMLKDQD